MRVMVAIPTFDGGIKPKTFESVANIDRGEHDVSFRSISGYDCAKARTNIADEMLERGFDAVLMVDSDVVVVACFELDLRQYPRLGEHLDDLGLQVGIKDAWH